MSGAPKGFFDSIFSGLFGNRTPAQLTCSHILSAQMPDGKYFCPSCGLASDMPLFERRAS